MTREGVCIQSTLVQLRMQNSTMENVWAGRADCILVCKV